MTYTGRVKNGVIVLDDPSTAPPEGTPVRVELVADKPAATLSERFRDLIGKAEGMPPDASSRIDDRLYGNTGE
jgi:hypothetical protein